MRGANGQLATNLAEAKAKCVELDLRLQAAIKSKETDASAATAREQVLRSEAEQARTRADTMSQSLAEVNYHVSIEFEALGVRPLRADLWASG